MQSFKRVEVVDAKWITRQKLIAAKQMGEYPFELGEAARYLHLPPSKLRIHMQEGSLNGRELPVCYQSNRQFYFLRKDLDAYLGVETPTLATASRPIKQIIQFLDELPITPKQRASLLGVTVDALTKIRDNRQGNSRTAHLSDCKALMDSWPVVGQQILTRWAAGDDLLQVVRETIHLPFGQ